MPGLPSDPSNNSWAGALPKKQGLYNPEYEKDACGVGFVCQIKGKVSHKIVSDARNLLCNMTHRGAVGADARDGDGAEFEQESHIILPPPGQYAVGNLFFKPDPEVMTESRATFEQIAEALNLRVLGWRKVPRDSSILGPAALSREPLVLQPFVVLETAYGTGDSPLCTDAEDFDEKYFERQLYVLRKQTTHSIGLHNWFYICSLSNKNIVYKGQLAPVQVYNYYHDLNNVDFEAHFCLVHSRFSTNTFPSWDRAQPLRWAAHNGEINTLRGNINWMRSREGLMQSSLFGDELDLLYPIIEEGGSDSAAFDNVLELMVINGVLSLPEAVMVMVPEAWQGTPDMDPQKAAFYEWAACLMEPWDGPALFTFADGRYCGANLDRNGLRPCRFYVTSEDLIICASEVGTISIDPEKIIQKGRLQPGKMLLVDTVEGRIVDDKELKTRVSTRMDFRYWIESQLCNLPNIVERLGANGKGYELKLDSASLQEDLRMQAFGYSLEQLFLLLGPMASDSKEALGSMGNDGPLACLAPQPRALYDYFRQLFAQVTNPPIDPIRESIVMSLECYVGPQGNVLEMNASQCHRLRIPSPILSLRDFDGLRYMQDVHHDWPVQTIDITFFKHEGSQGYIAALDHVCEAVAQSISDGYKVVILSDRNIDHDRVPLSSLLATGAVHHFLVRNKIRSKVALVVESGEAREVHHLCVLLGYGADAICPYLALESIYKLHRENSLKEGVSPDQAIENYIRACDNGILKVMSKMGISTLQSYKGAQIFEALGIDDTVIDKCFAGTASRIKGITFDIIAQDAFAFHEKGFPSRETIIPPGLPDCGEYHWRDGGDAHINDPVSVANLQDAARSRNSSSYAAYSQSEYESIKACTLRGMLDFAFDKCTPIPIEQVEPWTEIVRRFCTGAMSYGSISLEAHSTLAIAMNRLGGKSNTGEGGEDPERSQILENGDTMRSAIKQVASGRFGVTSYYLSDSDELQIKMAQGAKPGEGGELPGHKVSQSIARTRYSTAGVGLISPPPHHDIYSIEDLKQLIYDLKCSNPRARISVKLVSEVGVGIVASGVAKAKADHILISGHDGGTGAARWTGIKHAGLPWELGLAETHQTLVLNDLRNRVVVQADGQIRTGRDVAIACLLGAEEWGFATTPLIATGCIMMRKCHLNTCPVGIATQDPELRKKFTGQPEHIINFFYFIAEELRAIMAKLGFRTINEMVGRCEVLHVREDLRTPKTANLDISPILIPAHQLRPGVSTYCVRKQDHRLHTRLDNKLIDEAELSLEKGLPSHVECNVLNTDRAVGTTLSNRISRKFGEAGLAADTIHVNLTGSAGQSFGAFLASGVTLELEGDSNDYVGKGLSGGRLIIYPPKKAVFKSEENILIGNVCLYGATSGQCFFRGVAAERFCVRNSGASAVVEGVGDHCCEYMTGGRCVILGNTGRNFAAGMSGGIAYVLDMARNFPSKVNMEMVELSALTDPREIAFLRGMIEDHRHFTGSTLADRILSNFNNVLPRFVKVLPTDYKRVLQEEAANEAQRRANKFKLPLVAGNGIREESENPFQLQTLKEVEEKVVRSEPTLLDVEDSIIDQKSEERKSNVLDKTRGFMKYSRQTEKYRNPKKRIKNWNEISTRLTTAELRVQTARCMDCGVPFCQSETGCPISNIIPKWNELVFKEQWQDALNRLLMTNNFPEFTGRICPAPCEGACVLGINEQPVGIKSVECAIIDRGFEMGWIIPRPPKTRTGKRVAIIGSGPSGLAAADQLNKAGHHVVVYERADRAGGLLQYGIPQMKLEKSIVQRRIQLMRDEGIDFQCNIQVGKDIDSAQIQSESDAVIVATGATVPRDLNISNRNLNGIHFAMQFLHQNTKSLLDSNLEDGKYINSKGKNVIVIGGGDTGNDCIGTAIRHGAASVVNFELLPQPPATRAKDNPWPQWPRIFRVDYGHAECTAHYGKDPREYCIMSREFVSDGNGNTYRVEWTKNDKGQWNMKQMAGSEEFFPADLVLLSMGFLGPEEKAIAGLGLKVDPRTNIQTPKGSYATNAPGVFAAGDCRRGQSLVVWGIQEGRQCAREVDEYLMRWSLLPAAGGIQRRILPLIQPQVQAVLAG
ncbi:putative glutamate synthase [NADPH] [Neolecta irregularis DAH-3]|uniref:Glutamate synthase [NADH] n=1 Tax=Neolecta irregularis (strain DAH-3) TaxID=1198029 RepID=A0A1U7LN90_NEOID|nr:putative glutamate synthase [NADPH] [Neolecta irregularis DAH-3]|eukprot:OLL24012.1 putative glutamate synthase [NADPH] [Neolecta irregularis DAH-3]